MTPQQEEREQQSTDDLYARFMTLLRPTGTSLAATTVISALVRQAIHIAVRDADGTVNEENAWKVLQERSSPPPPPSWRSFFTTVRASPC
jgi:hypothetical protein